jgi:hypothetical protein
MLRLDLNKVREGVIFTYDQYPNKDKTVPWVKLAFMGDANRRYQNRLEALTRPHRRKIQLGTYGEAKSQALFRQAFLECCVIEWGNVQPKDDGVNVPYSFESATALFDDDSYLPFYQWMEGEAQVQESYRLEQQEEEAKNS